jgi:hypothetical protein
MPGVHVGRQAGVNVRSDEWRAGGATRFLVKHVVATAVTAGGVPALLATIYIMLFVVAILTNGDVGSPATLPIVLVLAAVLMTAVALAVFLPVTAAAAWIRARNDYHYLYEIPIAVLLLVAYIFLIAIGVRPEIGVLPYALGMSLALLPTLGVYWLCLHSTNWLLTGAERVVTFVRRARTDGSDDDERVRPD